MGVEPGDTDQDFSDILSPAIPPSVPITHREPAHCRITVRIFTILSSPCASPHLSAEQLFSEPVPCSLLNLSFSKYSPPGDITDV